MNRIAHRGFAAAYPENTLAAFTAAPERADAVELDVRRCGSGEPVVFHDARVDDCTDGSGAVAAHTAEELGDLSVLGSSEGVPTLREALEVLPREVLVHAELKEPGLATDLLAAVEDAGHDVVVSSFLPRALREVRHADPEVPTAYLCADPEGTPVETARDLGCTHLHPHADLVVHTTAATRAARRGLTVNAWTVNDPTLARLLGRRGVDGVITDHPDVP